MPRLGKMPRFVIALATRDATMNVAVVHGDRQRDDQRALRLLEEAVHPRVQGERLCGPVELGEGGPEKLVAGFAAFGILRTVTRAAD